MYLVMEKCLFYIFKIVCNVFQIHKICILLVLVHNVMDTCNIPFKSINDINLLEIYM